jgi:hypothetical protein
MAKVDPIALLHQMRATQAALITLAGKDDSAMRECKSLEVFLSGLSELWRAGEVRPTHPSKQQLKRHLRTRPDPFAGAWPEVLTWLHQEVELDARSVLARLQQNYPDQFTNAQLRTLQRRLREWRSLMAQKLVFNFEELAADEQLNHAISTSEIIDNSG